MSVQFCHIAPTSMLEEITPRNKSHLILAHLVETDAEYAQHYSDLVVAEGSEKIMDNSAFEMFKQGRPMLESDKLITLAKQCKATTVVLTDYPKENWKKTRDKAVEMLPSIKEAGFKTFYVPQSEVGDLHGYIQSVMWALKNPDIDYIGLSILGCPIALGLEEETYENGARDDGYKMQRFLSRWKIIQQIEYAAGSHFIGQLMEKRFHCLGLVDGPNEVNLLSPYHKYIKSWDSSSAIWAGIQGVKYDGSPTGLRYGKIESEVDFDLKDISKKQLLLAKYNANIVDFMAKQ